jgi:ketosteroid isomerase-like protein
MTKLSATELVDLVENKYFHNVDGKNLEPALDCFADDAVLTVQTAGVTHHGRDAEIRSMFADFMAAIEVIYHGDFSHVVDVDNQCIASQFVARNRYDDGRKVEMRNCNFFQIDDGRFKTVTIYMSGENPLV